MGLPHGLDWRGGRRQGKSPHESDHEVGERKVESGYYPPGYHGLVPGLWGRAELGWKSSLHQLPGWTPTRPRLGAFSQLLRLTVAAEQQK